MQRPPTDAQLAGGTARRVVGEPLEQILGWAAFAGPRLTVTPGVFVPRARTRVVVDQAVGRLTPGDVVVDLCCGTGAIGVALAAAVPGLVVHAVDVDPAAVACARVNLGASGTAHLGDLDAPLPAGLRGGAAVVVANAPYVPTGRIATLPAEARDRERAAALDGGADGLDVPRRVVAAAPRWSRPGGTLVVETGTRRPSRRWPCSPPPASTRSSSTTPPWTAPRWSATCRRDTTTTTRLPTPSGAGRSVARGRE